VRRDFIAVGLGLVAFASRASAAETVVFTLEYSAPRSCPDRSEFLSALRSRSKHAAEATDGAPDVALSIEVVERGELVTGALRFRLRDGQIAERAIPEASCVDAIASMAVIAALVIDTGSLEGPPPSVGDSVERLPESAPPPAATKPSAKVSEPTPARAVVLHPGVVSAPRPLPIRFGAVAAGSLLTAVAPDWTFGGDIGLDVSSQRKHWFSPSGRLSIRFAQSDTTVVRDGVKAQYRLLATSWAGCPVRYSPAEWMTLRPCALVEAGDLRGSGESAGERRDRHMLWLGFGAAARAELAVTGWLAFELEARELALVHNDRFLFLGPPDLVVHDVPPLATELRAGIVIRVP
jgi:hypothetical protein